MESLSQMTLFFSEDTCDRSETPIHIRFVKFGRRDTSIVQLLPKLLELIGVLDREMNVRRVVIHWSAIRVSVFNSGMAGLNCLLREWDIATGDCVQVSLWCWARNLELSHDASFMIVWFYLWQRTLA